MELIGNLLGSVEVIVFAWGIAQLTFRKEKRSLFVGILVIILGGLFGTYCPDTNIGRPVNYIVIPLLSFLFLFDVKIGKGIIKYLFCSSYIQFIYLPVGLVLMCIGELLGFNSESVMGDNIKSVIAILIMLCLARFVKKKQNIVEWIKELPIGYFLVAWICAFAVGGINSYIRMDIENVRARVRITLEFLSTVLSVFIYSLGIGFAFADYLRKIYKNENVLKDQYLQMAKEHYEGLVSHMQEIRKLKHDMQGHINALNIYAANDNWEGLKEHLNDLTEQHSLQNYKVVNTNNELVDAIIADSIRKGREDGITIECEGKLPENVVVSDFDWCTIFSNLLSNAIEACRKLNSSKREIHITLKSTNDEVRVVFENPIEDDVEIGKLGKYTSKEDKDNHGFGVANVRNSVEKYDGNMAMSAGEGVFKTIIIFYK